MKICILCTSYPRSKDDYWVPFMHSWAKELAKTEDVTVVTSGDGTTNEYESRDNVKIYRFNYFYPRSFQKLTYSGGMRESFKHDFLAKIQAPFFMLAFLIKSFKIARKCDVINAHWVLSGLAAIPIKKICKKPIVLTEHGGSIRGLPKWLNRFVLKRMDAITSAHYDMIESVKEMGINNVFDVKNFLNEEKFLKKHNKAAIKNQLGIKEEFIVTFIGRFEEMKDPLTFVNSVRYALDIGGKTIFQKKSFFSNSNIKFIMIGDGHLKNSIESRIKELKIEDYLFLPGATFDVDNFLAISDVFVACSSVENCFSTTILEAMLSKVPCIITKAGDTEKFFVHKQDAYLVEKKNARALGEAIINLVNNLSLRKKFSENGLEFLDRHGFRNKKIREKIMSILTSTKKH